MTANISSPSTSRLPVTRGASPDAAYRHILMVTGARTWTDETLVAVTFSAVWKHWRAAGGIGPREQSETLLVVGGNPRGADAIADRVWRMRGLPVLTFPAQWDQHGKAAGSLRNQAMVDYLTAQRDGHGAQVAIAAFLALCTRASCPRAHDQQLLPSLAGHFSHGTIDALRRAGAAGVPSTWVVNPEGSAPNPEP